MCTKEGKCTYKEYQRDLACEDIQMQMALGRQKRQGWKDGEFFQDLMNYGNLREKRLEVSAKIRDWMYKSVVRPTRFVVFNSFFSIYSIFLYFIYFVLDIILFCFCFVFFYFFRFNSSFCLYFYFVVNSFYQKVLRMFLVIL